MAKRKSARKSVTEPIQDDALPQQCPPLPTITEISRRQELLFMNEGIQSLRQKLLTSTNTPIEDLHAKIDELYVQQHLVLTEYRQLLEKGDD